MIVVGRFGWLDALEQEMQRLQNLLIDLERLKAGDWPDHADYSTAPVLLNPQPTQVALPAFVGLVIGHPNHADGHPKAVRTSPLEILASDGWFRSANRLYRYESYQS